MKLNNIIFSCAAAIIALSSCSDLLDIPRKGVMDKDVYYSKDENLLSSSAAMYLEVRGWEYNVQLCKNMLTDDFYAGGAARGDNVDLEALNEFSFTSEESYIENMFTTYYSLVYKANVILDNVDPAVSETAAMVVAEAHTLRAWAYFDLITMWGNPPIVDHQLSPSEYSVPNGSTEALWKMVEDDLTAAINSGALPQKSNVNDNTVWRVTKQFAQAVLGKAYLWQEKFEDAAKVFDEIVDSQLYDLFTADAFGNMFLAKNDMNCESMFESVRVNDNDNMGSNIQLFYLMTSWRASGGEMTIPSDVCFNAGWGFVNPTKDLYDSFVAAGDNYRRSETMKTFEEISAMGVTINKNVINAGCWMWKNRILTEEAVWSGWATYRDVRWMRFAEVLLCGAEAHLRGNYQAEKAVTYVNRVRTRAQLAGLGSVTMDDIKREKRHEFVGESLRFQDLVRWGDAAAKLKDNGLQFPVCAPNGTVTMNATGKTSANAGFKAGKHERLPYPYTETTLNKNVKQNPGY